MDLFWNLIVAGIAFVGAVIAGVLTAVLSNRATREYRWQDRDREFSELKGQLEVSRVGAGGSPGPPLEGNVLRLLGKLEADVANMNGDVAEIKAQQSSNRDDARRAHSELRDILQGQIDKLAHDLKSIGAALQTLVSRQRRADGRSTKRQPTGEAR